MPSKNLPCVHCRKPIRLSASIVKKYNVEVFLCDSCADNLQKEFKTLSYMQINKLVKESEVVI